MNRLGATTTPGTASRLTSGTAGSKRGPGPVSTPWRRVLLSAFAAFAAVAALLAAPAAAQATTTLTNVRVAAATSSSLTVTLDSLGSGWTYKLYASATKTDVYYTNLATAPYQSPSSTTPTVTVSGLPYTTKTYWIRVQATYGTSHHTGDILSAGVLPATPTAVTVGGSAGHGSWITWTANAGGFVVEQATDSAFTIGAHSYSLRGTVNQFTPYGLTDGARYYLRVRGNNYGTLSGWSSAVSTVAASHEQAVRVGTYNVVENFLDGTVENGNTISPWSDRVTGVTASIKSSGASVVGVQEAAGWVGAQCAYRQLGTRQIDDLVTHLGSPWALAQTEVRPCLPGWARTGVYITYDSSKFSAVNAGGQWNIGTSTYPRWAVYQQLRSTSTGAQLLFVTPHLVVGNSTSLDLDRQTETTTMVADAKAYAAAHGDPAVVYAGDFNSHELHPLDGPAVVMSAAKAADGLLSAQSLVNQQYNSANGYMRTPPVDGHSIDHVYAAPGVGVHSWQLVMALTSGSFVGTIPSDHNLLVADLSYPY